MAILINTQTQENVRLQIQHIFGRQPVTANTLLTNPDASRMHAVISWDGDHWYIQDSSTNGTVINTVRIKSGKAKLSKGDMINFGATNSTTWALVDIGAPQNMLMAISPDLADIPVKDIVALPSEEHPEVTIYMAQGGNWVCESEAGISILHSGDRVGTQSSVWRFIEAKTSLVTQATTGANLTPPAKMTPVFDVSQNEEHVSLKFKLDDYEVNLGQRNHHYLLLLLARKRLEDMVAGLNDGERGWIDKAALGKMAGLSENHINIQVYRFRKQLIDAMPQHVQLPPIIEKRRGEIRFGCEVVEINGGASFKFPPVTLHTETQL